MRLKLLIAMLFVSGGFLLAQDTIKTLIISEAKVDRADQAYIELTNVGNDALNLKDFELTTLDPWKSFPDTAQFPTNAAITQSSDEQSIERLPDHVLAPGESYVIGVISDQTERTYVKDVAKYGYSQDWGPYLTNPKLVPLIDLGVYRPEGSSRINEYGDRDSVSTGSTDRIKNYSQVLEDWAGRNCFFIRHHISPTDSAIVDQVDGLFTDPDHSNPDGGRVKIAGVDNASYQCVLIRRFVVKQGNTEMVLGSDIESSEWIPIPFLNDPFTGIRDTYSEHNRGPFWTVGNHLDAHLTDLTPATDELELDMATLTLKVPWGIRNDDSIMSYFNYTPGIAWHYNYAPTYEDSAFSSIRTGDVLTLYAVGNTLETANLTFEVKDPPVTENRVIPKFIPQWNEKNTRFFGTYMYKEIPYLVTDGLAMDTISQIPFATRTDTLLKYLEKPENASWDFVWVDGEERTDVKDGDLLRVTAEDGTSVKDYYVKVEKYRKARNDNLSSITWPDIPEFYKGLFGWKGDTIPNFSGGVQSYLVQVPADVDGIPALVAKAADQNATVKVQRAVNLFGSTADRTVTFTVTAENDTMDRTYTVELVKQKATENIQPWLGEPFISQWVFRDQWSNTFLEVVNPGTDVLDLSYYMFGWDYVTNSADMITAYDEATFHDPVTGENGDFDYRYRKYIPGRVWVDTAEWAANPATCEQDLNVNTMIQPGDVFVIGDINGGVGTAAGSNGYKTIEAWPMMSETDIFLTNTFFVKPNGDTVWFCPWHERAANKGLSLDRWTGEHIFLYKILNDSVRDGTKAATDPNDFLLLDAWGTEGTTDVVPVVGGVEMGQLFNYTRKPEIYKGNPVLEGSWGDTIVTADTILYPEQTTEWIMVNDQYFSAMGVGWALNILRICDGFGTHFMNEVTIYQSTVTSNAYKVSLGYSMDEEIRGTSTGTTVDEFLANINKKDTGQTLTVKSAGVEITGGTALTNGDSLVVLSADSTNTSMYFITVTDEGLSTDAVLTSETYTISTDPAEVGGFDIGTLLKDVVEGVNVPFGATMNVINSESAWVPLKTINFDTAYVDVLASSDVYFEVIAEDGVTTIVYQLIPSGDETDAYVTSAVFDVDQNLQQIKLIPEGTTVNALLANLVPSTGASMMLFDKLGFERTEGMVVGDDQLVVTAADGVTTNTYYLAMLGGTAAYLAYVVSDVYTVDQDLLTISGSGITVDLSVTNFLANLVPATGASMEVQDNTGAGKGGADMLADADMLHVLAANGVAYTDYSIILSTGVADQGIDNLGIYPNPTSGQFFIDGLEPGLRIRVYNAVGVALRNITAYSSVEQISLDDQPNGMYYITVSNGDDVIGRYKVIKQ